MSRKKLSAVSSPHSACYFALALQENEGSQGAGEEANDNDNDREEDDQEEDDEEQVRTAARGCVCGDALRTSGVVHLATVQDIGSG